MKKILIALALVLGLSLQSFAQKTYTVGADAAPALRISNAYTGVATIAVSGGGTGFVVTVDGLATTINGDGAIDTVAELTPLIVAVTNKLGAASLTVAVTGSLAADSTDGELLTGVYTAAAGATVSIPWDTSAALFYQVEIPANQYNRTKIIRSVSGNLLGTGDVTLKIYENRVEAWDGGTITSPTYELPAITAATDTTNTVNNSVVISENFGGSGYPFDATTPILVRATRGTTATTGSLTLVVSEVQ